MTGISRLPIGLPPLPNRAGRAISPPAATPIPAPLAENSRARTPATMEHRLRAQLSRSASPPGALLPAALPGLPVLSPLSREGFFRPECWKHGDALLTQLLQGSAPPAPAPKKRQSKALQETAAFLTEARKQVTVSFFLDLSGAEQTALVAQLAQDCQDTPHTAGQALLRHARTALAATLDPETVAALEPEDPLLPLTLAHMARHGWGSAELAIPAAKPAAVPLANLAFLSQLPLADWQRHGMAARDILALAMKKDGIDGLNCLVELSGAAYGFHPTRLLAVGSGNRGGAAALRTILAHYAALKTCLLDAGFQDRPQLAFGQAKGEKNNLSLRDRITSMALRGGTKALEQFVKHYAALKAVPHSIPGRRIADVANNIGGGGNLDALVARFTPLLDLLGQHGIAEARARDDLVDIADKGSGGTMLKALEYFLADLTGAPWHFHAQEIVDIARHNGGTKTLGSLKKMFDDLRVLLEGEGYRSRAAVAPAGDGAERQQVQDILKDVANRKGGTGSLEALRAYLEQDRQARPFSTTDAVGLLRRGGGPALEAAIKYLPILSASPCSLTQADIARIARYGGQEALQCLAGGKTFTHLSGWLRQEGYSSDEARKAVVDIAAKSGGAQALQALTGKDGLRATLTARLTQAGYARKAAAQAIIQIAANDGGAQALAAADACFDKLTAAPFGLAPADVVRIAANIGGAQALKALADPKFFQDLSTLLEQADYTPKQAARAIVQIAAHNGGVQALAAVGDYFDTLTATPFRLGAADVVRIAANNGGALALRALADPKFFQDLRARLAQAGYAPGQAARAIVQIAAHNGGAPALTAMTELLPILTQPPYGFVARPLVRIASRNGGAKNLLALVAGSPDPRVRQAAQRVAHALEAEGDQDDAGLDAEAGDAAGLTGMQMHEDDAEQDEEEYEDAYDVAQPDSAMPDAPALAQPGPGDVRSKRACPAPEAPPPKRRNTATDAAPGVDASASTHPSSGPAAVSLGRDMTVHRPELNRVFPLRNRLDPSLPDARFADPRNPARCDPDWIVKDLVVHPEQEFNFLGEMPGVRRKHLTRYATQEARRQGLDQLIEAPARADLAALMRGEEPPSSRYYAVRRLDKDDFPTSKKLSWGVPGQWGVVATEAALKEESFFFLGFYGGVPLHDDAEYDAFLKANGQHTEAARKASDSYLAEMLHPDYRSSADHDGNREIRIAGGAGSSNMARINAPLKRGYRVIDGTRLDILKIDEAHINTIHFTLVGTMRNQRTRQQEKLSFMGVVAYGPNLLQDYRASGKRKLAHLLLDYGQQHIDVDINGVEPEQADE